MNTNPKPIGARTFLSASPSLHARRRTRLSALPLLSALCLLSSVLGPLSSALAGTFSGNARVEISDPTGGLSWNSTNNALTLQCWFKISIPSGVTPKENMTILVNRTLGSTSDPHAYYLWFDKNAFNIKFSTRGTSLWQGVLIPESKFYLDRWYNVAVVRSGNGLTAYVDGQSVTNVSNLGDSRSTNGVSIGGWGSGQYLYGEVQEVTLRQFAVPAANIGGLMFVDQTKDPLGLVGYYKLGYSTNASDFYANSAPTKPLGTTNGIPLGSGQILFEPTDQKGEQSTFDATVDGGRNAVVPLSGAFAWQHTVFRRPTPGIPFEFGIGYVPGASGGVLGPGWRHSFETATIQTNTTQITFINWQGGAVVWETPTNVVLLTNDAWYDKYVWTNRDQEYRGWLAQDPNGGVLWTNPQQQIYYFPAGGKLAQISDLNTNSLQVNWSGGLVFSRITNIVDSAKGDYQFSYNAQNLLASITFGAWQAQFGYTNITVAGQGQTLLASKTLTNTSGLYANLPTTWRFFYHTNGLIAMIVNPSGYTNLYVQYDDYGRRIRTVNALGDTTSMEYGAPGQRQIRTTDPGGYQWIDTYDRKGRVIAQRDPLGNETRYAYDAHGNRTAITDPRGNTTHLGYDDRGNVIAQTNALGEVTRSTYHPLFNKPTITVDALNWNTYYDYNLTNGNLLRQYDALGTLASCTYTTNGLVQTATDGNGNTTSSTYDTNGFVIAQTDTADFITHFTPNELGWNLKTINALSEETTYAYDLNGKIVRTLDALGRSYYASNDACGDLVAKTDGKGQWTRYTYDALRRKTSEVDRAGNPNLVTYTSRGKPAASTDALGRVTTCQYDAANRQIAVVDPMSNTTTTVYDAGGNAVASIDPLGRRWTKTFDRLNRVVAESDPFGNTAQTLYDAAGRVRETIAPNGARTLNSYDGRGHLTNWVDAAGSSWSYAYDGVGNITNITDARLGQYAMAYGPRKERTMERNQDGKEWYYYYDELLRLKIQREPNGTERNLNYDTGGRLTQVTFPKTGRTNSFAYDANDNPTNLLRSGSGPPTTSHLAYDAMDRVQSYGDTFGNTVGYSYDAAGRMTMLTYPDGKTLIYAYDALDQLSNQVFQFSPVQTFTTSYFYDQAGQLIRRTYPNGVIQTNTFDTCGRLTGLSHSALNPQPSALNLALAYAYDRNGNTIRATQQGTYRWPVPALRNETAAYRPSGQLIQRDISITNLPQPSLAYHYDASGNMTNATGGGQSWSLAYDEDNRTTSVHWDAGITSRNIANRYDAFGRRVARAVDGDETRYVLDLGDKMERILCDVLPSGLIVAWYVHGPDLAFKVNIDGGLNCYHADAQGNIIALTGAEGVKLIEYAYTPYGRSLGSTNYVRDPALDTQPFLYVGSQGVMMEERGIPGLYFMRARYYSADAGVFLSTDPVKNIGPTWRPIAYCYADGNPLAGNDPTGELFGIDDLIGFVVGAIIGAAVDFTVQMIKHHGDISKVNWGEFGAATAVGALTGVVTTATAGAGSAVAAFTGAAIMKTVTQVALDAAWGAAGEVFISAAKNKGFGSIEWQDVVIGAATGGLSGRLGKLAGEGALERAGSKLSGKAKQGWEFASKASWRNSTFYGGTLRTKAWQKFIQTGAEGGVETGFVSGGGGLSAGISALKASRSSPTPDAPTPSVWHPSSSPVFTGCDCGK